MHFFFFGTFGKIVCWRPPEDRRPLLQGMLYLPQELEVDLEGEADLFGDPRGKDQDEIPEAEQ